MWHSVSTAPFDHDLELAIIDLSGVHAIAVPCRRILGGWMVETRHTLTCVRAIGLPTPNVKLPATANQCPLCANSGHMWYQLAANRTKVPVSLPFGSAISSESKVIMVVEW